MAMRLSAGMLPPSAPAKVASARASSETSTHLLANQHRGAELEQRRTHRGWVVELGCQSAQAATNSPRAAWAPSSAREQKRIAEQLENGARDDRVEIAGGEPPKLVDLSLALFGDIVEVATPALVRVRRAHRPPMRILDHAGEQATPPVRAAARCRSSSACDASQSSC